MKEEWILKNKKADFDLLSKELGLSPVVLRVLANRGYATPEEAREYLNPQKGTLCEPSLLLHAEEAAERLLSVIREGRRLRIIGDYDVDGIMSTYLLYDTLNSLGARVDYRIPDRMLDGYGMNLKMVEECKADGVEVILTCDNGIAAREPIAKAKEYGMEVIVTDHHDIPTREENGTLVPELPIADLIVNPKQPGETYPQPGICGAMVAYKVICLVLQKIAEREPARKAECEHRREALIVYAALATVCDVMELVGENRTLVARGLEMMPHCENAGIRELLRVYELADKKLSAYHAGFLLGPCFNAAGRLETALLGLELLLCKNPMEAAERAAALKELNDTRKTMTVAATEQATELVKDMLAKQDRQVLVVYLPDCHESLAGIVAGRIKEQFYRPTIVLTKGEHCIKGSGRSIPGYSMFDKLSEQKELFLAFGGHPMAAGMSLSEENITVLEERLNAAAGLSEDELTPKLYLDSVLPFAAITETLLSELAYLEPFGNGNPKPVFAASGVTVSRIARMGKEGNMLRLNLVDGAGTPAEGVLFHMADAFEEYLREEFGEATVMDLYRGCAKIKLTLAFSPGINEYMGRKTTQCVLQNYKATK